MDSTSLFSRRQGFRCFGTILGCLVVVLGSARAAELEGSDEFDTLQARAVFLADDELRSLHPGVAVRDHVAYLWGPIPSKELSLRAEIRLRTMLPLANVRNEFIVVEERGPEREGPVTSPPMPLYLPDFVPSPRPQPEMPERILPAIPSP